MSTDLYVPDTSAILTLMEDEPGADRVEKILREGIVILPAMVLLEVYYTSIQRRSVEVAQKRYAVLKSLPVEHQPELTEPVLIKAGEFKANHRISLADSIIAAHAAIQDAVLVHKDPEYEALQMVRQIRLPYKKIANPD